MIAQQVTDIFNLFLKTGLFPASLKFAKVIPIYKNDSKLKFSN